MTPPKCAKPSPILCQSVPGSCRFLADTTHPDIFFIIGARGLRVRKRTTLFASLCRPQASPTLPQRCQQVRHLLPVLTWQLGLTLTPNGPVRRHAALDSDLFTINGASVHNVSETRLAIAHSTSAAGIVTANASIREITYLQRLARAWHLPLKSTALCVDDNCKPRLSTEKSSRTQAPWPWASITRAAPTYPTSMA
jgi:hypothetical protein